MSIALGATATTTRKIGATPITKRFIGSTLVWSSIHPYVAAVLADSPLAYWRLGEASGTTAVAEVGSNGTVIGGVTWAQSGALTDGNTAAKINGTTGGSQVGIAVNGVLSNPASVAIECWYKRTSSSADVHVLFGHRDSSSGPLIQLTVQSDSSVLLQLRSSATALATLTASGLSLVGQWVHIVGVLNVPGNSHALYINGVSAATNTTAFAGNFTATKQTIGDTNIGTSVAVVPVNGWLDEVAIYSILSAAKIIDHYNKRNG